MSARKRSQAQQDSVRKAARISAQRRSRAAAARADRTGAATYTPRDAAERALAAEQRPTYDEDGRELVKVATCGHCGRSWNDAAISGKTPAPSSRCPFEYEHVYDKAPR